MLRPTTKLELTHFLLRPKISVRVWNLSYHSKKRSCHKYSFLPNFCHCLKPLKMLKIFHAITCQLFDYIRVHDIIIELDYFFLLVLPSAM